jgi:RNA polymerase sigma factor (sigma-70 family)
MATAQPGTLLRHIRQLTAGGAQQRTDRQLLDDFALRRSEAAFAALVGRHGPMVLRVCRRVLRQEQDAEDAFQATFLVLAGKAGAIRNRDTVADWLYGVAYRTAMCTRRSTVRRQHREARAGAVAPRATASPSWDDVRAVLDEEVQRLPPCFREAFVLCVLEGKGGPEAAAALGCKEGTVKSRVNRARHLLRQRLARRGIQLSAVLAALSLARGAGKAAVPAALAGSTVRFGLSVAAGGPAAAIPSHVAALAAGVTRAMSLSRIKLATAAVCAVGLIVAGAFGYEALAQKPEPPAKGEAMPGPAAKSPAAAAKDQPADKVEISGRVLDPDGKPAAGAKLFVPHLTTPRPRPDKDVVMKKVGEADAEGRFRLALERTKPQGKDYLIARADGFGVDWVEVGGGQRMDDVSLRLVKDVPITGRVVDTEGRPVAGVSVSVAWIFVPPNEKLDGYLAGWQRNWLDNLSTPRKMLDGRWLGTGLTGAATTDKEGRFTLHGAGGERIVGVTFAGGVARSMPFVITRAGFDPEPYNAVLRNNEQAKLFLERNPFPGVYGPSLTFVAQPGKAIEGVVKDAATGKPLPGCELAAHVAWIDGVVAVAGADGRFRIDGLPKRPRGYQVFVSPPEGSAYLGRIVHAADTDGFAKVPLDIDVVKGAVVVGRVVDRQTGRGVEGGIRFVPLPDNKFVGSKPGFDVDPSDQMMRPTDKDGRFRLTTIPGKAFVLVQAYGGEKLREESLCPYRPAVLEGGSENFRNVNAVKVIDAEEGGETQVELFVDRGATARIAVQDADGKPLAGTWAGGLTAHWPITYKLPEPTATVYALDPKKPRTMAFLHVEKKLGGTAVVRGDEKEPVVVKLAPLGQVAGRLLDTDGNALDGVEVSINPPEEAGSELYRFAKGSDKPVRTDKDGRFRVEGVVPGLKFWLGLRQDQIVIVGDPRFGLKQVKPGEKLDLGDIRVKPAQ